MNSNSFSKAFYTDIFGSAMKYFSQDLINKYEVISKLFVDNLPHINSVICFMNDKHSKDNYIKEIRFLYAKLLYNKYFAMKKYSLISRMKWDENFSSCLARMEQGEFSNFSNLCDRQMLAYCICATFIFEQYRYDDIVNIVQSDVVLDCGGCYGDFSLYAQNHMAKSVYSFEPVPNLFSILSEVCERNRMAGTDIVPVKLAVSSESGKLRFTDNLTGGSMVDKTGTLTVDATTIDSWCDAHDVIPTFIKMDLEGHEPQALAGSANIIRNYKPKLAICLYHKVEHMWEIPLQIIEYNSSYKFYCKKAHPICEFVLFAKP